ACPLSPGWRLGPRGLGQQPHAALSAAVSADKPHPDLRDWIELADSLGCLKRFQGASWDLEVGALTSLACREVANPPCLLFDEFAGFPAGWRVLTNAFTH